ncbi:MAG: hypothetical protein ACPGVU_11355 [Limisphaerales bacterium]
MYRFSLGCLVAGVGLSAAAGERIIFSSRDGRQVEFDYSRSVRLLPPEVAEGGFNKSSSAGAGSLMPFGDPSMSPSAMRRRKMLPKSGGSRDWIFANPADEGRPKSSEPIDALKDEEREESAMVKFMKGEPDSSAGDGREDSGRGDNNPERKLAGRKRKRLDFRDLNGANGKEMMPLKELESQAGFSQVIEGQPELTRFLKADFRREEDARHRRNMADFRARLSGTPRAPVGNVFGGDPSAHGAGGFPLGQRPITIDFNPTTGPAGPNASSAFPGAGIPGAFESRSMPLDASGRNAFNKAKQQHFQKRKPLDMKIRKRDF